MARDEISLQYVTYDKSDSAGSATITKQTVTQANGICIKNAFAGKNNSLVVTIDNTYATADSTLTVKAGEKQNKGLGDLTVPMTKSKITEIRLNRDMARFERKDGSIYLDFSTSFTGTIYATAEKAGLS